MRHWGEEKRSKARIEIIPMIDVMMFLLVFFVLLSLNVIPALGVHTKIPQSSNAEPMRNVRQVIVTLDQNGAAQLDGKAIAIDSIAAALIGRKQAGEKLAVIIKGDEATPLQRLIDVMDELKTGGFEAVSIATARKG